MPMPKIEKKKKTTKKKKKKDVGINEPHPGMQWLSLSEYNCMVRLFKDHPNGKRPFKNAEFLEKLHQYVRDDN